jgi:hypothetical protein
MTLLQSQFKLLIVATTFYLISSQNCAGLDQNDCTNAGCCVYCFTNDECSDVPSGGCDAVVNCGAYACQTDSDSCYSSSSSSSSSGSSGSSGSASSGSSGSSSYSSSSSSGSSITTSDDSKIMRNLPVDIL